MLVFYGTRSATCRSIETGHNCPVCGKEKTLVIVPFQVYAHLFWIPMFPMYRTYAWVCTDCEASKSSDELPVPPEYRRRARTPKWTFFGLAAILAVILFVVGSGASNSSANKKASMAYINAPMVGDIYEVELDNDEFSLMKVMAISADSVYFVHHEYNTGKKSYLPDLMTEYPNDFFSEDEGMDAYARKDLPDLFTYGGILKVLRHIDAIE